MCLALPVKVIVINENNTVDVEKERIRFSVSALLFPEITVGDYVLVHGGFIIQKIDRDDAIERIEMIDELYRNDF